MGYRGELKGFPVETIKIAGKKFDKNEVENALKDLKPIE